ncbi:hypothetical protein E2C01_053990 [Portunus trituberculatus]|uniref:Uncharacterized protein n=1 Tax=Portunus trituberculatus TaxID=210409 RepID=A0A5B7GQS8_PORTR|nr:hypothetical protein [Portunus trituberculatus]
MGSQASIIAQRAVVRGRGIVSAECCFQYPDCDKPLIEYMLNRKVVMGLSDCRMKGEVLQCFPHLDSMGNIVGQCKVIEAVEKTAMCGLEGPVVALHSTRSINHVVRGGMKLLESLTCEIMEGTPTISKLMYIVEGVQCVYLSLKTCKALELVPLGFLCLTARVSSLVVSNIPESTPTRPALPPYKLVMENVEPLEKWFLEQFWLAMKHTPLIEMKGPPHHIHLWPRVHPYAMHVPATIPFHFYD